MIGTQENFRAANGRRSILIVDDESINRDILGMTLEEDYDVLYACDGQEALDMIREQGERLSLILLDLMMPVLSGLELLKLLREDPQLRKIPVLVLTADQDAEIDSLHLGAVDFIPKPYPRAGVIQARVQRIIELHEDRETISATERDPLTGLYTREYFYRYARQLDQYHAEADTDAVFIDINHFRIVNERYGKACADDLLRRISEKLRSAVEPTGGIVGRLGGDTFMLYLPHRDDYRALLEEISVPVEQDKGENPVRLRMGVYRCAGKELEIERSVDRAKLAAETVRGSFGSAVGYYDNKLHERELFAEQLIEDFSAAVQEKQFLVFYQPKFDVRPDRPALASAEALVRWQHPRLGLVSPGTFVPLFEENGLIRELDEYVWRATAAQIADWKRRLGRAVPVSVNVSRVDMYDPKLADAFTGLLEEYGLGPGELLLEITESAYTHDSNQIISSVSTLRDLGFRVEMDDFGTGYSSLSMISHLPIDALKLDMSFIREAFRDGRDTRMIEVIIDIARYLEVPVIAEGVETEEQLQALRAMGCAYVQGYYFSRPVPAAEFERFLLA
jgi:diguanylate cyclase (GGDEF)-like protein